MKIFIGLILVLFTTYSCTPPSVLHPVAEQNYQNIKSYAENVERSLTLTERLLSSWLGMRVSLKELGIINELSKFIGSPDNDIKDSLGAQIKDIRSVSLKISEASAKNDNLSKEELEIYAARRENLSELYPIASDMAKNVIILETVIGDIHQIEAINTDRSLIAEERIRLKKAISRKYSSVISAEQTSRTILNAFGILRTKIDEQRNIAIKHSFALLEYSKAELPVEELFRVISQGDVQGAMLEIIKTKWGEKEAKLATVLLGELSKGGK